MGFLAGKRALITGIASDRSIAYGIAEAMHREGAELAFTYQNDKLKTRVEKTAKEFGSSIVIHCDVATDASIEAAFKELGTHWDGVDIVIHSIAFAPKEQLSGSIVDNTTREGSQIAHDISAYSFVAMARYAKPMMAGRNGSLLALSYLGAVSAIPNYNVMGMAKASLEAAVRFMAADLGPQGIRVNAISAGPIRTLAAAGIAGFRKMLDHFEKYAPMRRNVTIEEVGNVAAFLSSDLASGVTGEITYVDGGWNILGMSGMSEE
ncbi:MAG TPA: enoyl-ACP reductase [Candidatus Thiothrix moscowensis]|uniref:enoyl-ACP reductase FabI n=1 Tax=unclassified Thiothrix TaxID=2636184 RepID=UPI0025EE7AB0|nr:MULTISPECIES: enoyl-ACP reductase [unclassified Thiothrix]HRJ53174.1 enoyl-ACP reductase [Candidatus Thiothrix moscowensis]HRJ93256.1 enoyl-ACP reductase [Candidatus Thiothrix moscowensis]